MVANRNGIQDINQRRNIFSYLYIRKKEKINNVNDESKKT